MIIKIDEKIFHLLRRTQFSEIYWVAADVSESETCRS